VDFLIGFFTGSVIIYFLLEWRAAFKVKPPPPKTESAELIERRKIYEEISRLCKEIEADLKGLEEQE